MEVTDREDLGSDLRAPKSDRNGKPKWHYELVRKVQPGDIVFHWHRTFHGSPAIVGWSRAIGPLETIYAPWSPRTSPQQAPAAIVENWRMPLGNTHLLDRPITREVLLTARNQIVSLEDQLKGDVPGFRYYPFIRYGGSLRAQQAYLTKFPRELLSILGPLGDLELNHLDVTSIDHGIPPRGARTSQGFLRDAKLKHAIESHAVSVAIDFYKRRGATSIQVLGKPYDIRLMLDGIERHIEVKGSSTLVEKVMLTRNEVEHARSRSTSVDLFVVDDISWESVNNDFETTGGRIRLWKDWAPIEERLSPISYTYALDSSLKIS